jgi:ectoine hydroxylase-related dioxygenase (phytanoyl-CoA dioxygenase family)
LKVKTLHKYQNWEPVPHHFVKEEKLRERLHTVGYSKLPLLKPDMLEALQKIYQEEHKLSNKDGGMFYSMYSKDLAYRKRVHQKIEAVLAPVLEEHFQDYKNVINTFVVKLPGEKSEFYVHQDTSGMDEFQYSPLSLWIPLQDIQTENGALALIEKSQWFFSPYRGVSFPFPFRSIHETVKEYLQPIEMKKGEALFFDNRIIHNSLANTSSEVRIAIVCGIFPKEAGFRSCYQKEKEAPIEVYAHDDNYLLEYPHFFYDCTERPSSGKVVKKVQEAFPEMDAKSFEELCTINKIPKRNTVQNISPNTTNCELIAEPDGINRFEEEQATTKSWIRRLFTFL